VARSDLSQKNKVIPDEGLIECKLNAEGGVDGVDGVDGPLSREHPDINTIDKIAM
jgi:hypothetical protein